MSSLPPSPSLARVARGDLCSGCGACAALAPGRVVMRKMPPGYLRPEQLSPLTETQEAAIAAACPGLGQKVAAEGRKDSILWGPYLEMRTGWAMDQDLRHAASSGGALSAILVHLLKAGHVDAVITTTADPDNPVANIPVATDNAEVILQAAGSRYAPSMPLADLPERLAEYRETGRRFALVGKPCDISALRVMQARDPEWLAAIPVCLSFFCAGVPSEAGANAVLTALGADPHDVTGFRYRGNGWPGRATAILHDGSERSMTYHDSWGGILSKHAQNRCKICADATGGAADIVCADAWESDDRGYPVFDEADGISLIVARTALGLHLVNEADSAGIISTTPFDIENLAAIQPGQRERKRALLARLTALRLLGRPVPRYEGLHLGAAARQNTLRRNMKNFLGTLRRALRRKTGR